MDYNEFEKMLMASARKGMRTAMRFSYKRLNAALETTSLLAADAIVHWLLNDAPERVKTAAQETLGASDDDQATVTERLGEIVAAHFVLVLPEKLRPKGYVAPSTRDLKPETIAYLRSLHTTLDEAKGALGAADARWARARALRVLSLYEERTSHRIHDAALREKMVDAIAAVIATPPCCDPPPATG